MTAEPPPAQQFLDQCQRLLNRVRQQQPEIEAAAELCAASILADRMVHVFGSGHSRIMVEEMWPRYGSFPGFHPMVELSLTFHNPVVGSNGQRQAMFLENTAGFAERILRNFHASPQDTALVVSSSGCNVVPIEIAEGFRARGVPVIALVSREHADGSQSKHPSGLKLADLADIVLDTGAPLGDAMVRVAGLEEPVGPGSTIGGCMVINALKVEIAARLAARGAPPRVLTAAAIAGADRSAELFEAAYDEHGRRLAMVLGGG